MLYIIPGLTMGLLFAGLLSLVDFALHTSGRTSHRLSKHTFLSIGVVLWLAWAIFGLVQSAGVDNSYNPIGAGFLFMWLVLSAVRKPHTKPASSLPE